MVISDRCLVPALLECSYGEILDSVNAGAINCLSPVIVMTIILELTLKSQVVLVRVQAGENTHNGTFCWHGKSSIQKTNEQLFGSNLGAKTKRRESLFGLELDSDFSSFLFDNILVWKTQHRSFRPASFTVDTCRD